MRQDTRTPPAFEDFDPETQDWIRRQVAKTPVWSDEYATHVTQLFIPGDYFLVTDEDAS